MRERMQEDIAKAVLAALPDNHAAAQYWLNEQYGLYAVNEALSRMSKYKHRKAIKDAGIDALVKGIVDGTNG